MPRIPDKKQKAQELSLSRPGSIFALQSPSGRRRGSRLPSLLGALLILAGVLVLADAGITLVWQEPISALYAQLKQESLGGDLRTLDSAAPPASAKLELARLHEERRRVAYLAAELQRHAKAGSAVGRIRIPTIGASFVVVKGTGTSELESGPGIYSETAFPGVPGTTAIAGHRTTYLAPFRHIDALRRGQPIVLEMPYARLTYRVIGSRVVLPTDVSVLDPVGYSRLVLSACTPLFSASHRLIVFARLSSTVPLGAARLRSASKRPGQALGPEPVLPTVLKPRKRLLAPLVS
ncbi:MAG TPA: class E sortase [Solirubrobacteraceae bacterium]